MASKESISELMRVLGYRKFGLSSEELEDALDLYLPYAELHSVNPKGRHSLHTPVCRDPKDQVFLDLAQSAKVDYLVTGDDDLLVLDDPSMRHISFRIFGPSNFLSLLGHQTPT